jgi:orotidine-5'-phosphate decarboxylase
MAARFKDRLLSATRTNRSIVCVGLDFEMEYVPKSIQESEFPIFEFNRAIIEATKDLVCAYKPNTAFYERHGERGWSMLRKTIELVPEEVPVILDVKRADIGNTSQKYAEAYFDDLGADAVTVNPYMGSDAVEPFIDYEDRGVFVLCRTTNPGAKDFQDLLVDRVPLFEHVARKAVEWNTVHDNVGIVGPATEPTLLQRLRKIVGPNMPILAPGVGAQGGNIAVAVHHGANLRGEMLLLNASRSILFASQEDDFAEAARRATARMRDQANDARNVSVSP